MLKNIRKIIRNSSSLLQRRTFLSSNYKCLDDWNKQISSPTLNKINPNDFYNVLDQNYSLKGVISAIDVDIFANAIKDQIYLEELKDLLHKLRLSAETGNTLESTHHATIRKFIEFGDIQDLINILKDPLNFGLFLDDYTANILLDNLITSQNYELAASVASLIMLQEDYTNDITCSLCQYACYMYVTNYKPPEQAPVEEKSKKVEEIKIRVKFLRNPYFDDHFDIQEPLLLAGKTLAWISQRETNNLNKNLQIIGWLMYKKYDEMLPLIIDVSKTAFKVFVEVIDLIKKEYVNADSETKLLLDKCISLLDKVDRVEVPLEESLKNSIENSINKVQNEDILRQQQLFKTWMKLREDKLEEQTKRLDRARRMQLIQQKQEELKTEEQKLWFFENEENIDLQIEEKEKLVDNSAQEKKNALKKSDENYIPPEIVPKRR